MKNGLFGGLAGGLEPGPVLVLKNNLPFHRNPQVRRGSCMPPSGRSCCCTVVPAEHKIDDKERTRTHSICQMRLAVPTMANNQLPQAPPGPLSGNLEVLEGPRD